MSKFAEEANSLVAMSEFIVHDSLLIICMEDLKYIPRLWDNDHPFDVIFYLSTVIFYKPTIHRAKMECRGTMM